MATDKQITANRANAQKSTGPKSDPGRAAVRHNALRHGLAAETFVLTEEDKPEFEETRAAFEADLNPLGPIEILLVQQIVVAAWRLRRARVMSTGFLEFSVDDGYAHTMRNLNDWTLAQRLGFVAGDKIRTLELIARYEARIERSFFRTLHELERRQTARTAAPDPPPRPARRPQPDAPGHSAEQSQIPPVPAAKIEGIQDLSCARPPHMHRTRSCNHARRAHGATPIRRQVRLRSSLLRLDSSAHGH